MLEFYYTLNRKNFIIKSKQLSNELFNILIKENIELLRTVVNIIP